jgi:hypothetical protein
MAPVERPGNYDPSILPLTADSLASCPRTMSQALRVPQTSSSPSFRAARSQGSHHTFEGAPDTHMRPFLDFGRRKPLIVVGIKPVQFLKSASKSQALFQRDVLSGMPPDPARRSGEQTVTCKVTEPRASIRMILPTLSGAPALRNERLAETEECVKGRRLA